MTPPLCGCEDDNAAVIVLEDWPQLNKQTLPYYNTDFLRNIPNSSIECYVIDFASPPLNLEWNYYKNQKEEFGVTWFCTDVWLHCYAASGETIISDLEQAINIIASDKSKVQYTLLVNPDGMEYDRNRFGGDHQVRVPSSGRMFTFSVRRRDDDKKMLLLAIAWN